MDTIQLPHGRNNSPSLPDRGPTQDRGHVSNYQVHAALAKTAHFQVNNDFEGIHHNYGNRLHAKQFLPGNALGCRKQNKM